MTRRAIFDTVLKLAPLIASLLSFLLLMIVAAGFGWKTPNEKFLLLEQADVHLFDSLRLQRVELGKMEARQAEDRAAVQLLLRIGCRPLKERDLIQQCDNVGAR